jgi:hypothetical protein
MMAALLLAAAAASQGRLVVLVVVDQLRYQDVLWLAPALGPRGFAGMGPAVPMRYETAVAETASGHAVLSTGAYADVNGIVGNSFWQGARYQEAVDDPACPVWGVKAGRSAAALRAPTIGDMLKLNTGGAARVVGIAVKDRSALFLVGPSADLALWWEADIGEMASTACYAPGPPAWLPRRPAEAFKDWVWTLSRPDAIARLLPQPRATGARPVLDLGPEFPHTVGRGKLDDPLYRAIRNTPAGTTIALRAARSAVAALKLGEAGRTDLLTVALASVDTVGHQYGTLSRERVDAVLRMHDELSAFLDELRKRLGTRLSIVLTSDHGLTPTEADEQPLRVPGGTVATDELIPRINRALDQAMGARPDGWVAGIEGNSLALRAPFPARAIDVAVEVLRREPGGDGGRGGQGGGVHPALLVPRAERTGPPGRETALDTQAARRRRQSRIHLERRRAGPLDGRGRGVPAASRRAVPCHAGSAHRRGAPRNRAAVGRPRFRSDRAPLTTRAPVRIRSRTSILLTPWEKRF